MSLAECLRKNRVRDAQKAALIFGDRRYSYAELDEVTDRLAASLVRLGIRAGDRVALLLANCPEMVFGYYACFKIGAAAVPLNIRLTGPEIDYVLNHCGARVCISQPDLFAEVERVRPALQSVERFYLIGDRDRPAGVLSFAELIASPANMTFPDVAPDAVAVILYTSGTTARPKGVTHTHHTLARTLEQSNADFGWNPRDVTGVMTLFCHISGFWFLTCSLNAGATVAIVPRFEPALVLRLWAQQRVTKTFGVPVMYNDLVKSLHCPAAFAFDLSSLQLCLAGGDAVPVALQDQFRGMFGLEITEICGMTEVVPYSVNPVGAGKRAGSIGKASAGKTLRLVDDRGRDVPAGEVGEILVQSEATMVGYWQNPEATAAVLRDGWLSTGDLARRDAEGYYWFVGRKKDIIVRGGSNISPLEVEEILYQHPAVKEAAVFGVPNPTLGETVQSCVALRAGQSVTAEELRAFLRERLAVYKVPEAFTFLPELPKGLTGKISRKALREQAMQASAALSKS